MKYCSQCGSKVDEDAKFCNYCGTALEMRQIASETPPPITTQPIPKQQIRPVQKIEPIESVQVPNVEYADFGSRLVAWIIDLIIIGIIGSAISWAIFPPYISSNWWWHSTLVNWLIGFLYLWILESQNQGQTIGKLAMHLRTVDEKSFKVTTPSKYAINNLLKTSGLFLLDLLIGIIVNSKEPEKRKLRFTQNLSETVVIKLK